MTFQIKNFRSIAAGMLNVARLSQDRVTDFSVGSVARTLLEAPAAEIEELYLQFLLGLKESIPIAIYQAFDFEIVDARPAGVVLTLTFPGAVAAPFSIPAAAVFESGEVKFQAVHQVNVAAGATSAQVQLVSQVAGSAGNIAASSLTYSGSDFQFPAGTLLTHPAVNSGRDAESEQERKARFIEYVGSLSRGTVRSVKCGAALATVSDTGGSVVEYVSRVGLEEAPGHVTVYLRGSAGAPSDGLLARALLIIDGYVDGGSGALVPGYRAAGVEVEVLPMVERPVSLLLTVGVMPGIEKTPDLSAAIKDAVQDLIGAVESGGVLRADAVIGSALSVAGVRSCFSASSENVVCGQNEVLVPGVVSVSWLP